MCTEAMLFLMPQLDMCLTYSEDSTVFFSLDFFKGYWQLLLVPESQEWFEFMTHRGMYTPTRVSLGLTDAVAYCQHSADEVFGDTSRST